MDNTKGLCSPTHKHRDDERHADYVVTDPAGEEHIVAMCADMAQEIEDREGFKVVILPLTPSQQSVIDRETWGDTLDIVNGEVVRG